MDWGLSVKIQNDFATISRQSEFNGLFKLSDGHAVSQYLIDIDKALFKQLMHGVPSRPHLPSVDAFDVQVSEHHFVHGHGRHRLTVDGEDIDVTAHSGRMDGV